MLPQFISVFAEATEGGPLAELVPILTTAVLSATVFSALITGFVTFLINSRNSRITERKNTADAESDVVSRYKEAASEERQQKESAVQTIKMLLAESRDQVVTLKGTVDALNNTINLMESLTVTQNDMIIQLTVDRDRTQAALEQAEARILTQREELKRHQEEIRVLLTQTRTRDEAKRIVAESFNFNDDVVE